MNIPEQTEEDYLRGYSAQDFHAPLCTVDVAVFGVDDGVLKVLLVRRRDHPFRDCWALPGGFPDLSGDSDIAQTAHRKLREKTGLDAPYLEQVESIGNATRDPRGWSVTLLYFALLDFAKVGALVDDTEWVAVDEALARPLAFDHVTLLQTARTRLQSKTRYTALPMRLMPEAFTLSELQQVCETILGHSLEKKSFRRRLEKTDILTETGEMRPTSRRPAKLYRISGTHRDDFVFPGMLEAR